MRNTISRLLDDETRTADNWRPTHRLLDQNGKPIYQRILSEAREFLKYHRDNTKDGDIEHWGHWGSLLVPHILSIQRQAIVDLHPVPPDRFPFVYGVTFDQFQELCKSRFIIPNVYQDMDLRENIDKSAYLNYCGLEPLFDKDDFGTRILGIRREKLISYFFPSNDQIESDFPSFRDAIIPTLRNYDPAYLDRMLSGARTFTHEGCAKKLFRNLKYICALGSDEDRDKSERILQGDIFRRSEPIDGVLRWIRGAKIAIASPITAAFGGIYNCKSGEDTLATIYSAANRDQPLTAEHRAVDNILEEIIDLNIRLSQARDEGISALENPVNLPLDDNQFKSFMNWLKENKDLYRRVDKLSQPVKYLVGKATSSEKIPQIGELSELLIAIYRERHCPPGVKGLLAGAIKHVAIPTTIAVGSYYITDVLFPNITPESKISVVAGVALSIYGGKYLVKIVFGKKEFSSEELAARRVFNDYAADVGGLWKLSA